MALIAACAINAAPAAARDYPYCIKGCDYGSGLGDCSFATYQQCQASASSRLAYCGANPYFSHNADLPSNRVSRRR
jgi:hypothetical protein